MAINGSVNGAHHLARNAIATIFSGGVLALLLWIAALLADLSHSVPAMEKRLAALETRVEQISENLALSREAIAVLKREMTLIQDELRSLRQRFAQHVPPSDPRTR
jgi:uncharacterized coiled-coil protein SlyX